MYVVFAPEVALTRAVDRLKGKGKTNSEWFQIGTATLEVNPEMLKESRFKGLRSALEKFARAYIKQVNQNAKRDEDVIAIHIHGIEIHREYGVKGLVDACARVNRSRAKKEIVD